MNDDNKPSAKRTKTAEPAGAAIERMLKGIGLPVPALLEDALAGETPSFHEARSTGRAELAVRADQLMSLRWPRRAVEAAQGADVQRPAILAINSWEPSRSAIVLAGTVGCGKTVAAAWWALGARRLFYFVRAAELVRVGRFAPEWKDWLRAPALCVDDLGAEYTDAKGSFSADLDLLIDTYYSDRRPLIITTNCDAATFVERYGTRVNDRITECATWANVTDGSLRDNR